jgi:hypothetical protein
VTRVDEAGAGIRPAAAGAVVAGRYRLRERIGRGSSAEVWAADDGVTGDPVAVKLLRERRQTTAQVRREIVTLRMLRVPGVVRLLDEGLHEDSEFLVMDLVEGTPFPGRACPCTWEQVAPAALALLDVLGQIHAVGVVHRDLKPSNVLMTTSGAPVVLDFGLARPPVGDSLSGLGQLIGTPAYIAPECVRGEAPTPRSDLFAFGVMLFEILAGTLPYLADTLVQTVFSRVFSAAPSLATVAPSTPRDVVRAVDALLDRNPDARPQSAAQVAAMLRGEQGGAAEERRLPWVGPSTAVDTLIDAALAGRSADVVGPRGSGRTRTLLAVGEGLKAAGREVFWLRPDRRAFKSLGELGPSAESASLTSVEAVIAAACARLGATLAKGAVVLADDAESLDAYTQRVLAGVDAQGAVLRAVERNAVEAPRVKVHLTPWDATALAELFDGPERLFHVRSDAASILLRRTGGHAARVVAELDLWERSQIAVRRGDRYAPIFEALNPLSTALRLRAPSRRAEPPRDLSAGERDLLHLASLAWPDATPSVLAAATGRPLWEIAVDTESLCDRGFLVASGAVLEPQVDVWCDWPPDRLTDAHRALARALPPGTERRLLHLIAAAGSGDDVDALVDEALLQAEAMALRGALDAGITALDEALHAIARIDQGATAAIGRLLVRWTEIALLQETARALDRALYVVCRHAGAPAASPCEALLRAGLASLTDAPRALALAEAMPPLPEPALERQRQAIRVRSARAGSLERERAVVFDAVSRLGDEPSDRAVAASWRGRLSYREGRFAEAARLQLEAAGLERWPGIQVTALARAASAWMEDFDFSAAEEVARETRALAARCRHTLYEALAEWVLRTVSYRCARAVAVDEELIDAASALGVRHVEALVSMTEGAIAWRSGRPERARPLAEAAARIWSSLGMRDGELLARAFAVWTGAAATPTEREAITRAAAQVPRRHWEQRIDVLSVAESLQRLGLEDVACVEPTDGARPSHTTMMRR